MHEITEILVSFATLTILEIVLGVDNLVFLNLISQSLPPALQRRARRWGLMFAWVTRLLLLFSAVWLSRLSQPLFYLFGMEISGRDIFLFAGGVFLLFKATQEIHQELDRAHQTRAQKSAGAKSHRFFLVVLQIAVLDIIFSLDSVLTAIGLTQRFWLMAVSITIAILVMLFASELMNRILMRYPSIKMLALSFLILIGMVLVADAFEFHVPRGYVYFAMGFSLTVEFLNLMRKKKRRSS